MAQWCQTDIGEHIMHKRVQHCLIERSIALIGMAASGKTKLGKKLAGHLRCNFVDTDDVIVENFNVENLQEVVDLLSPSEFAATEEAAILETVRRAHTPTIIATGGSACYSTRAMELLAQETLLVHLWSPRDVIIRRIEENPSRGLVRAPDETIGDLYDRRMPLYCKWAHRVVDTGQSRRKAARRLVTQLIEEGIVTKVPTPSRS
jgi:shikimate kinase